MEIVDKKITDLALKGYMVQEECFPMPWEDGFRLRITVANTKNQEERYVVGEDITQRKLRSMETAYLSCSRLHLLGMIEKKIKEKEKEHETP